MAYFNPLHSHVAQSQVSTYSSLVDAFGEPSRTLGRRRCVPYPPSGLSATNSPTWPRNIPLSEASPNLRIDFNMLGAALGSGLPVVALVNLEKNALASLIADPHDQIYVKGFDNLKLQIYWPGYPIANPTIPLLVNGGPITRLQLAVAVAKAIATFVTNLRHVPVNPKCRDWSLSANGNLTLEHIWVVGLNTPVGNSIQVEMHLDATPATHRGW